MATARITGGYGHVPGYGRVSNATQKPRTPVFKPGVPGAPAAPAAPPAAVAPAPPQTPASASVPELRDSIFNSGVNGLLFKNRNARDDLTAQDGQATTDFNTMLSRMADNRAQDLMAQNAAANKQGLFYSGQLGKRRDQVDKGYDQRQSDAQTGYDRAHAANMAALNRLGGFTVDPNSPTGYAGSGQAGVDLSDLLGAAVGRQTQADANGGGDLAAAAQIGQPAQSTPAAAVPAVTGSSPQSGGGVAIKIAPSAAHGGAKWVYHRGAGSQWIPVRPA